MSDFCRIPDDVWEGRCKWCIHKNLDENRMVPNVWLYSSAHDKDRPCRIMGTSRPDEIPGECKNFSPNYIFGICATCRFDNCFHEGFCTRSEQPNKRQVYIGQGYAKEAYWGVHRLSTCDAYEPDPSWTHTMRKQALEGKIPRNFNPETMEPIGEGFEETKAAIRAWADADLEHAREKERAEAEKRRRLAERIAEDTNQVVGQMAMDLTGGLNG